MWLCQEIFPLCGSILQARTCQIFGLSKWRQVWLEKNLVENVESTKMLHKRYVGKVKFWNQKEISIRKNFCKKKFCSKKFWFLKLFWVPTFFCGQWNFVSEKLLGQKKCYVYKMWKWSGQMLPWQVSQTFCVISILWTYVACKNFSILDYIEVRKKYVLWVGGWFWVENDARFSVKLRI